MSQKPSTIAVRSAIESDTQWGSVVPPLVMSSNFTFDGFNNKRTYDYTRSGNPTRDQLADAISDLEGGSGGVITSSGMSAIHLVLQLLEPGDRLIAPHDCYGGTYRLLEHLQRRGHFEVDFANLTTEEGLRQAFSLPAKMVWVETPSNPLLRLTDLSAVAALAESSGALFVVDNTFLSPLLQRPLDWGADIVVHSNTKYINGHSDVVGGSVVAKTPELHEKLAWWANCIGSTGAPFDSYLTLRGLRTLDARLRIHEQNARHIAEFLDQHPGVHKVYYPGLSSHPGHEIAARQQQGFGGMLSFELGGGEAEVRDFLGRLQYFSLAESLGGVESLVSHPATMTHAAMDEAAREKAGIRSTLIRLSVGIESGLDLVTDLSQALSYQRHAQTEEITWTN